MSHRSLRSTLAPLATGLVAIVAVLGVIAGVGVAGSAPAFGAGARTGGALAGNPARAQEWWLASLNVTTAWRTTRGAGITVAVLGTGVAASHPDLAGDVVTGPDDTGSGREPGGPYWGVDGTAVAGLIAGHGHGAGRQAGITGVAPAARILSVRVNLEFNDPLNSDQAVTRRLPGAIAAGITYAVDHGARVIDLPLDPGTFGLTGHGDPAAAGGSPAERAAVAYALRKSVVLVAPAGDDGEGPGLVNYPAAYGGVIAVGAISRSGHLAPFSSRRSYVSLTAPGTDLIAPVPPDGYAPISSTSTASGIVAGVAALLLARFPHLTVAQVTRALTQSTVRAGGTPAAADGAATDGAAGPGTGYGTVNAARAVDLAARITSAGAARAATPPAKPRQRPRPARRPDATPRRTDASAIAGSLVRDVVAGLGVLIVLLVALLLAVSSRRKRDAAADRGQARAQGARGQHEHRRADRAPEPDQGRADRAHRPDQETGGTVRPQLVPPSAPAAAGWPVPGGWPGGSAGEIGRPPGAPFRPVIAPAPEAVTPLRGSRVAGGAGASGGPPWASAPEPGDMTGPLPVAPASSFTPPPGPGIRVPGDMTAPPPFGVTAQPPPAASAAPGAVPAGRGPAPMPDFDGRAASPDFAGPAAIPDFADSAPDPDTTQVADGPDTTRVADGPDVAGTAVRPDRPTRRSLDFATAPVAVGHPAPASGSVWDLAATDVFPVAPPAPDDPDDTAPGASGS